MSEGIQIDPSNWPTWSDAVDYKEGDRIVAPEGRYRVVRLASGELAFAPDADEPTYLPSS